jgi:hypothetical protein
MPNPAQAGNGYALLIGIGYRHWPKGRLGGTLPDIDALQKHFTDPVKAGFLPGHVVALTEENASASGILSALDRFAALVNQDPNATAILYYSGHGGTDGKDYFLVPYDFDLNKWAWNKNPQKNKVVLAAEFAARISAIRAKKMLVMLDACHSENIPVEKMLPDAPDSLQQQEFLKGFVDRLEAGVGAEDPGLKTLSPQMQLGSGKVILTSCEAGETSLDLGYHGLFTKVLLECLNGNGNIENDGWVRLLDLMRYVPKRVKEEAATHIVNGQPHRQNPMFKRIENLRAEDFVISAYDMAKAKELPPEPDVDSNEDPKLLAMEIALNTADYPALFELLDAYFGDNPTPQYSTLKQTINHYLSQGLMPPAAAVQGLRMLINQLKKRR